MALPAFRHELSRWEPPRLSSSLSEDEQPRRLDVLIEPVAFEDDFYLNLMDWSAQGIIATGQGQLVVGYPVGCEGEGLSMSPPPSPSPGAAAGHPFVLVSLPKTDSVAGLAYCRGRGQGADPLAVSSQHGRLLLVDPQPHGQIAWQAQAQQQSCGQRIGVLAYNPAHGLLSAGGKDHRICHYDPRSGSRPVAVNLGGHRLEVCGMQWSGEGGWLATGGNDNALCLFDVRSLDRPMWRREAAHAAAIKALCFTTHHSRQYLLSGGGSADRAIRAWNLSELPVPAAPPASGRLGEACAVCLTSSQVCTLTASPVACPDRIVSTHGFTEHHISVWQQSLLLEGPDPSPPAGGSPTLSPGDANGPGVREPLACLTGHSQRVLYSALSPDGRVLASGSGDGSIRLWRCFGESGRSRVRRRWEERRLPHLHPWTGGKRS